MLISAMKISDFLISVRDDVNPNGKFKIKTFIRKLLFSVSFQLLLNYRLGKYFESNGILILSKFLKARQIKKFSCQISYKSTIGKGLSLPHPIGIVIGDGVTIEDNVKIWQGVTLGSHGKKEECLAYPYICSGVKIYADTIVLGDVKIGFDSTLGAKSMVLKDVPPNYIAFGIPAKFKTDE